ncbi:MAG: hypothetical protein ACUVSG_06055, partial [Anaerolineae bacterium]
MPGKAPTGANGGHRQPADIVPGQLQGALAPNMFLGILRKGREAIDLLKHAQVLLCCGQGVKTAEVLIGLVKAPDHQLYGIVCSGVTIQVLPAWRSKRHLFH